MDSISESIKNRIILWEAKKLYSELHADFNINKEEAKEIFLFLYDYTNSFKNSKSSPEIMKLAWEMLKHWIDHDKLIVKKTKKTLSEMKLCSDIIKNIKLYSDDKIAWVIIDKQLREKHNIPLCIQDSFMNNLLLTITWTRLNFILSENKNWSFEIILGSKYEENNIKLIKESLKVDSLNNIYNLNPEKIIEKIIELF